MKKKILQKALSLKVGVLRPWGSLVVVQRDQEESTGNPFWQWSPNTISIRWCWDFTPWPCLVPEQCLELALCISAMSPRWSEATPGMQGWGWEYSSVGRKPRWEPLSCSPRATGAGWGVSAAGRRPGLSPAGAAGWGRAWFGSRMCQADGHFGWCLAGSVPQFWLGSFPLPLQCLWWSGARLCTFVPTGMAWSLLLSEDWKRRSG